MPRHPPFALTIFSSFDGSNILKVSRRRSRAPASSGAVFFEENLSSRYAALKVRRGRAPGTGHCAPLGATRLTLSWDGRGVRLTSSLEEVILPRKEVIQPHLPVRLPCYDFTPVMKPTVAAALLAVRQTSSGEPHSHGVTGGVYKTRERIHRGILIRDY